MLSSPSEKKRLAEGIKRRWRWYAHGYPGVSALHFFSRQLNVCGEWWWPERSVMLERRLERKLAWSVKGILTRGKARCGFQPVVIYKKPLENAVLVQFLSHMSTNLQNKFSDDNIFLAALRIPPRLRLREKENQCVVWILRLDKPTTPNSMQNSARMSHSAPTSCFEATGGNVVKSATLLCYETKLTCTGEDFNALKVVSSSTGLRPQGVRFFSFYFEYQKWTALD